MITNVFVRAVLLGGLLAGVFVPSAMAEGFLFRSTIIGSNPNTVIGGVPSGGAPWTVQCGSAALNDDGPPARRDAVLDPAAAWKPWTGYQCQRQPGLRRLGRDGGGHH